MTKKHQEKIYQCRRLKVLLFLTVIALVATFIALITAACSYDKLERQYSSSQQELATMTAYNENNAEAVYTLQCENYNLQQNAENAIYGKMVTVELSENEGGYFDLIVTPAPGVNVSTEWDLLATENYKNMYLTGTTEKQYQDFYIKNWKPQGIAYSWDN